jgi:hypothetical protein
MVKSESLSKGISERVLVVKRRGHVGRLTTAEEESEGRIGES